MSITSVEDLLEQTLELFSGSADDIGESAQERATEQAMSELGWTFPITAAQKQHWAIERCRRHILFVMMTVASTKFQYKHIHLEHRFKHLKQMIDTIDEGFLTFVEDNPELFDNVAGTYSDFTWYITSGFVYSIEGIEV